MSMAGVYALGQTIQHFPHSWQDARRPRALSGWALCSSLMAERRLVGTNRPAVQTAVQLPQAMHLRTSGSTAANSSNFFLSKRSRLILELGTRPKPNLPSFSHQSLVILSIRKHVGQVPVNLRDSSPGIGEGLRQGFGPVAAPARNSPGSGFSNRTGCRHGLRRSHPPPQASGAGRHPSASGGLSHPGHEHARRSSVTFSGLPATVSSAFTKRLPSTFSDTSATRPRINRTPYSFCAPKAADPHSDGQTSSDPMEKQRSALRKGLFHLAGLLHGGGAADFRAGTAAGLLVAGADAMHE